MRVIQIILLSFLILLIPGIAGSGSEPDILLLNSDASIEKYRAAQEEYKKTLSQPVSEYTIEGFPGEISELYRKISRGPHRLIYCIGTNAYLTAIEHAPEKTILFSSIINWRRLPRKETVFGISNELHPAMHLMHFKNIFPKIKNIGVLYSREFNEQWIALSKEAAEKSGIRIISQAVMDIDQTDKVLKKILPEIDALWLIPDPIIISSRKNLINVIRICDPNKTPVFSYNTAYAKLGATLIVAVDDSTVGRQAAVMSNDLLAGRVLPENVQHPAGSQITVNLNKVKVFGIPYRQEALDTVNTIFESENTDD
jgi:putative ABC transport system substrate-binding protein